MVTHILGCLWIFTGNISDFEEFTDNQGNQYNINWITKNGFDEIRNFQLYTISFYYTVTTIATVGYGDITLIKCWRLLSVGQAVNGVLMAGWSTAQLIFIVQRVMALRIRSEES